MAFTANKNLEQVARGAEVGTWDTPTNSNWGIVDNSFGGVATIALAGSNVTLSAAQYQNIFLTFTGAITSNIAITFPAVGSIYTVQNLTSNTSAFIVTATTTAAGGQVIGLPPGEVTEIMTDATNVKFRNFGRVGTYWDYAGSSVPAWLAACTVPPYLYCDGTAFSSATYPILATIFGGTTLPDFRGRARFYYNDGTSRLLSTGGGIDGDTLLAYGGAQTTTLSSVNLPNVNFNVTDPGHTHTVNAGNTNGAQSGGGFTANGVGVNLASGASFTGITVASGGSGTAFSNLPPGAIGGITMVRAA